MVLYLQSLREME